MKFKIFQRYEVKNYPYGYSQKTSMFFWVEFDKKKGYRTVRQSVNPKSGLLNKPKKSTYHDFYYLKVDDNKASFGSKEFWKIKEFNSVCHFFSQNWSMLDLNEKEYLYGEALIYIKVTLKSMAIYCNSNVKDMLKIVDDTFKILVEGLKTPETDFFKNINLDVEALEKTEDKNYKPFKVTN